MKFSSAQRLFMAEALKLAWQVKGTTFPNPAVGAIVVAGQEIIGRGATSPCGGPHAEKIALAQAGARANHAALYTTLEPCCHFGRTPPCTDAIIASGIKSVYISTIDPNPLVLGRGLRQLKKNGIAVYSGLLSEEANSINEDFFWSITRKLPWITLKLAMTLDGRIADEAGHSQWITSAESRTLVHELRRRHAGIIVGAATLRKDDPKLTVRFGKRANPARIVFSSSPRLPATSYFIKNTHKTRSIVVIADGKAGSKKKNSNGLEIWYLGGKTEGKNLESFLQTAYSEGLTSLLVEGGSTIASLFMKHRRVNRVYFFYGNKLVGNGLDGFSFSKGLPLSQAIELQDRTVQLFGDDVLISGIPVWKNTEEQ
jgi:diaminohydroxyphosphoribosylaminopyrimidine deaminase / 5-amino-6-(5-phosphoribosylamino)uracil reductase